MARTYRSKSPCTRRQAAADRYADQLRDAVHLRIQELIARNAQPGGWKPMPEQAFDRDARSSRAADVLLCRGREWALLEVWDWFDDVGASFREWDRRLAAVERFAISRMPPVDDEDAEPELPSVGGCWVVRGTRRNRDLVRDHSHLFRARFPGSARAWITALASATTMPSEPALLWVTLDGSRLY